MNYRRKFGFYVALCSVVLICGGRGESAPNDHPPKVLVLFEGKPEAQDPALAAAIRMSAIMGHFRANVKTESVAKYESGALGRFDCVFFIGTYPKYNLPSTFLHDVARFRGPLCWAGNGLEQVPSAQRVRWNVTRPHLEKGREFKSVLYQGHKLLLDDEVILNVVSPRAPKRSVVIASMVGKSGTVPYLLRTGDFWFVVEDPFARAGEGDRSYAFADALHEIMGQRHSTKRQVMLRIEDVNQSSDMEALRGVADILSERRVPFIISLVPVYINPGKGTEIALSSRRDFIRTVQYMIAHGGTVLMHGYTHQYQGISTDDYEFWDRSRNGPIREDSVEYITSRLELGLRVCFDSGIYPVAWETPHFAASMLDYHTLARYFSTAVEQRVYLNTENFGQDFPYRIQHDWFGQQVLPDNAGYVPLALLAGSNKEDLNEERQSVQEIISNAEDYKCVRDVFAGVFFHPFLNRELLPPLVEGLKQAGYTFVDLKSFNNRVAMGDKCVITGSGTMSVTLDHDYLRELWLDPHGRVRRETYSSSPVDGTVSKRINCRTGWIYVAEGARSRPPSALSLLYRRIVTGFQNLHASRSRKRIESQVVLFWNPNARGNLANDQSSFEHAYRSAGFRPQRLSLNAQVLSTKDFSGANWLIVPQASALSLTKTQLETVLQFVNSGGNLVTDGSSRLAERLGIMPSGSMQKVRVLRDLVTHLSLNWEHEALVRIPRQPEGSTVLYQDNMRQSPLGFSCPWGKGTVVFLAPLFDPYTGYGYSHFPTLITNTMPMDKFEPPLHSSQVEFYFDPAYRENLSIEPLAVQWRQAGVRTVHVSMWYDYPEFSKEHKPYDYGRLIRNCHANGILVYGWFEPPYLTYKFWEKHPQWREKNWRGEDVRAGWRWPLAMEIPACKQVVLDEMKRTLGAYKWDGINIAELDFECNGPEDPDKFQPMHPYFRQEFQKKNGFDPVKVLDEDSPYHFERNRRAWKLLEDARVEMVTQWHREVLQALADYQKARQQPLDVIVTAQDSLHAPQLRSTIGMDILRIVDLMRQYDFTLNVEDPEEMWSLPPDRYERIGRDFRRLVPEARRLMIDINVMDLKDPSSGKACRQGGKHGFAATQPVGTELTALIQASLKHAARVVLYSESNVLPQDIPFLASAYASVSGERWMNDRAITGPEEEIESFEEVPCPRLLRFSGRILSQDSHDQELTLRYRSHSRCLMSVASVPDYVWVDGQRNREPFHTGYYCHTIALPAGEHTVRIMQQGPAEYHVQVFGDRLSTAIVGGGKWACLLLFGMFAVGRFYWKRDRQSVP